jgi:hypothetical protein
MKTAIAPVSIDWDIRILPPRLSQNRQAGVCSDPRKSRKGFLG